MPLKAMEGVDCGKPKQGSGQKVVEKKKKKEMRKLYCVETGKGEVAKTRRKLGVSG